MTLNIRARFYRKVHPLSLVVGFFFAWLLLFDLYYVVQALKLVPVPGVLTQSIVGQNSSLGGGGRVSREWYLFLEYNYEYHGIKYSGERLSVGGNGMGMKMIAEWKNTLFKPLPRSLTVFVNPNKPEYSALERNISPSMWLMHITFIAVILGVHLFLPRRKQPGEQ